MKYIISGNYHEFLYYCHRNKLAPEKDARYITDPYQLYGLHGSEIILYGTYYKNSFAEDIWELKEHYAYAQKGVK